MEPLAGQEYDVGVSSPLGLCRPIQQRLPHEEGTSVQQQPLAVTALLERPLDAISKGSVAKRTGEWLQDTRQEACEAERHHLGHGQQCTDAKRIAEVNWHHLSAVQAQEVVVQVTVADPKQIRRHARGRQGAGEALPCVPQRLGSKGPLHEEGLQCGGRRQCSYESLERHLDVSTLHGEDCLVALLRFLSTEPARPLAALLLGLDLLQVLDLCDLRHQHFERLRVADPLQNTQVWQQRHNGVGPHAQPQDGLRREQTVHRAEKLLHSLVQPDVLAALHQEPVLALVTAEYHQTFGLLLGGHDEDLRLEAQDLRMAASVRLLQAAILPRHLELLLCSAEQPRGRTPGIKLRQPRREGLERRLPAWAVLGTGLPCHLLELRQEFTPMLPLLGHQVRVCEIWRCRRRQVVPRRKLAQCTAEELTEVLVRRSCQVGIALEVNHLPPNSAPLKFRSPAVVAHQGLAEDFVLWFPALVRMREALQRLGELQGGVDRHAGLP
mmetsp:Transcript_113664/g.361098  ORF Transcript_113664/g.361098 Transcript_113664/m.361098 type:complete len:495 (+) Transcript_113664:422-1906(+)